jgi:hypothetical protein
MKQAGPRVSLLLFEDGCKYLYFSLILKVKRAEPSSLLLLPNN